MFFSIKIGFKDLDSAKSDFSPPNFAYIQTPLGSSVRSNGISQQGDTGYLLYLTPMDEALFATTAEMLNTGKVTVGFNRKKDGLDVLVPLDLRVAESQVDNYGNVSREMSDESIIQFLGCYKKLMERWVAQ